MLVSPARSRPRTAATVVTVLALAGAAGTAELTVRGRVADRFATAAEKRLGEAPDVGLGGTPALWQLARGTYPEVELEVDGASVHQLASICCSPPERVPAG